MPVWADSVARYMATGLWTTIGLSLISSVGGVAVGILMGICLTSRSSLLRAAARGYVELWRGLPVIVGLFFIFFVLPTVRISVQPFAAASIGLILWASANVGELVRGAVESIPVSQREAASSLGLSSMQGMVYVILPQAIRRLLPPLAGLLTDLIQSSALASQIGVLELLEAGSRSMQRLTFAIGDPNGVPILGSALIVFFVLCFPFTMFSRWFESRLVASH
jgi:polar amino acid transport system permease protein